MSEKAIQLTNIDKEAIWKSKNPKTGNTEMLQMADMEDYHLQAALIICQKRKLKNFMMFLNDSKREQQLLKEAKNRNMKIANMDDVKVTYLGAKFMEFEDVMSNAFSYINKKLKQIQSAHYDATVESK